MHSKNNFLSISKIDNLINSELVINIRPSWDKTVILPYFIQKSGLNSNSRLGHHEFMAVFNCLLFLRVNSDNFELKLKIENLLRNASLPAGFQNLIKHLPLSGSMYRIKDNYVKFILDKEIVSNIEKSYKDGSLAKNIGEMSRHLNSTSNARREVFNSNFLTSGNKYFIANSYFQKNPQCDLSRANLEFNLNSRTPELDTGVSLALIFGFTCMLDSDLRLLLGIVASTTMKPEDYDVNVINAFEFMLSDKSLGPSSGVNINSNPSEKFNSEGHRQNLKPILRSKSLLSHKDVVDNLEYKSLKSLGIEHVLEKLIKKTLSKLLLDINIEEPVPIQTP